MKAARKKPGVALWATVVVVVGVPILYVASSGPTRRVVYKEPTVVMLDTPTRRITTPLVLPVTEPWWSVVYAPLQWASAQWWGQPLVRYWNLFPTLNDPTDRASIPPMSESDKSNLPAEFKRRLSL